MTSDSDLVAYYLVRSGDRILGRHCLAWPVEVPPGVSKPLLRRHYKDYPDAVFVRDPDQSSTAKGVYVRKPEPGRYLYQRKTRAALRKALRVMSLDEIIAMARELAGEPQL